MHEIRHLIARMRLGESDRDIARAGAMGRPKAAHLRVLALEQGWLDLSRPLPPNDVLESLLQLPKSKQPSQSLAILPLAHLHEQYHDKPRHLVVIILQFPAISGRSIHFQPKA